MVNDSTNNGLDFEKPILDLERRIEELENFSSSTEMDLSDEIKQLKERSDKLKREIFANLKPWQRVQISRMPQRPETSDFISQMCDEFIELHGDRYFRDDQAIVCGFAKIEGEKMMIIGHKKGRTTKEKVSCNFGCAHPEGYRKAYRKMKLAEKCKLPVITLINTPGAYPGIGAEERGQAHAIAENLFLMSELKTPIICIIIGEGGSGGALGIGIGDRILILENAYLSVISPEGCAAILWRKGDNWKEAAEALKLTAKDLIKLEIVDEIINEPLGGAHRNQKEMSEILKKVILKEVKALKKIPIKTLLEKRYKKIRNIGRFIEKLDKR